MQGRDPHEQHRVATPLELLYDLAFVIAFGVAGSEFAHLVAEGHYRTGLLGFVFSVFAVVWAWISFTWFASAYDTDDWIYRLCTMTQMIGVVVLALGLPAMFASVDEGGVLDNRAMVAGYVVMRVPMLVQWLRAAASHPEGRRTCLTYAVTITVSQIGWVVLAAADLHVKTAFIVMVPVILAEVSGPFIAERTGATSWHPHHIAERYGLLAIIALGEVLIGTVAALSAVIHTFGWSFSLALFAAAGVGLTFGLWWLYFLMPAGEALHANRAKSFAFGYGHFPIYGSIAAIGAGLHVAALYLEHEAHISATAVMWSIAIPVIVFHVSMGGLTALLAGARPRYLAVSAAKIGTALVAVAMASAGTDLGWCVAVIALGTAIGVINHELA